MLPSNLLALVNSGSLATLPALLPSNKKYEYHARFLLSGPDVAIELTPTVTRVYINGIVCKESNAFTAFVEDYEDSLSSAYRRLTKGKAQTVVLTGRWHVPAVDQAYFEAYITHVLDEKSVRSMRYDLQIFDNDYHQSAMTFAFRDQISESALESLRYFASHLTSSMRDELTPYRAPIVDGVAWLCKSPNAPAIFCHQKWPLGLDKSTLDETLKIERQVPYNQLTAPVEGPVKLADLMTAAREPVYYFQIRFGNGEVGKPATVLYDPETYCWPDLLFTETKEYKGVMFATEWQDTGRYHAFRVYV